MLRSSPYALRTATLRENPIQDPPAASSPPHQYVRSSARANSAGNRGAQGHREHVDAGAREPRHGNARFLCGLADRAAKEALDVATSVHLDAQCRVERYLGRSPTSPFPQCSHDLRARVERLGQAPAQIDLPPGYSIACGGPGLRRAGHVGSRHEDTATRLTTTSRSRARSCFPIAPPMKTRWRLWHAILVAGQHVDVAAGLRAPRLAHQPKFTGQRAAQGAVYQAAI